MISIVFSLYYAARGIMEKMIFNERSPASCNKTKCQKIIIDYIQEGIFKVIFTISGFIALFIVNNIFSSISISSIYDISAGTALLIMFLIFWGITGVSGYLTLFIVRGIIPFK